MKIKPLIFSLSIIALVVGAGLLLTHKNTKGSTKTTTTTSVQFVSSAISADGIVTASNQETLNFQTGGKLIYLPFKEGDKVLQGQIVAKLDTAKLEANLRQAEQDFTAAKAVSEKLYNDQAGKTDESYDEKIKRTAVDAAQNKAYDAVVKARQDITDATLVTSINGIIMHEGVTQTGINITPGTGITVEDPDTMIFRANVPAQNIYYMSENSAVTLAVDGIQNKIQGLVIKIYPSKITLPTGQAVYQVDIASDDLMKMGKLDENGTAIISTNAEHVALVPVWTVLSGKYIWVIENGTPVMKQVNVGKIHGSDIEITGGLTPDDAILINPEVIPSGKYQLL